MSIKDHSIIALISEVFFSADGNERLCKRLREAKQQGAALAVLPELPLNSWCPADKKASDADAEFLGGPRHQALAEAARSAGIALIGGAIVRDAKTSTRRNTALVFDSCGALVSTYQKLHIPAHEGFWESFHYDAGTACPSIVELAGFKFGIQICSDINRPEVSHMLGAMAADVIVCPRATKQNTYPRWRTVFAANAITSTAYVASVNRPVPEQGVNMGGPSIGVTPTGEIVAESTDPITLVAIRPSLVKQCREEYPGYLPIRSDLYARGWRAIGES